MMIDLELLEEQSKALIAALPATRAREREILKLAHWARIAASYIKAHQCGEAACGANEILRAIGEVP